MRDLRVGVVLGDGPVSAWQTQALAEIEGLVGVAIVARWPVRGALEAPTAGADIDIVANLTHAPSSVSARLGVLQLVFAEAAYPGRAEVRAGNPVSQAELRLHTPQGSRLVGRHVTKTARNAARNYDRVLRGSTFLFSRALRALRAGADPDVEEVSPPTPPSVMQRLLRRVERTLEKLFCRTRWTVGFAEADMDAVIRARRLPAIKLLHGVPSGRFFADPFPLRRGEDEHVVLLEDGADHPPFKGRIAEVRFDRAGRIRDVETRLEGPDHFSFPFLFEDEDAAFCIPENFQSGDLRAWRTDAAAWREDAVLLAGFAAVDPALCRHDGKWWLFACDRAHEDTTHLYLFHADDWRGPWTPHVLNPVKSDVRGSRPAGAVVVVDGGLYRPAQDCSLRYGGALVVHRITTLSATAFAETEAFRVGPETFGGACVGVHTLNGRDGLLTVDVLERRFRLRR